MYVFVIGMERCGTHSAANIIKHASSVPNYVVHEEVPFLCREAKLLFEGKDFRTDALKEKVRLWRNRKKRFTLLCEANHRFCYFTTFLAREFPECKIVFLYRDPIATIVSRLSIWSHYPEHLLMYPEFYRERVAELQPPHDFNEFRITPPKSFVPKSIIDLYVWEWLENYKFARRELTCIPHRNRLVMLTDNLTKNFDRLLGFIGMNYFKVDDEVMGWARVKSDSVYVQQKEKETDVFITRNRDPEKDETVLFSKDIVNRHKSAISTLILGELGKLPADVDDDLLSMDKQVANCLKVKMV